MKITIEDIKRYLTIERGLDGELAVKNLKRRFPKIWADIERAGGLEIDETDPVNQEVLAKIRKWKDWHNSL